MSLRIAFDLDGVLADMSGALRREAIRLGIGPAEETAPEQVPPDDEPRRRRRLSDREQRRLWAEVRKIENFWTALDELEPGSVSRLDELATARRWEVLFITTRPETAGETTQRQSQRWLERCGFHLPSVYVVSGSRGKVAAALDLDIVVDDRPENCVDVKGDSRARPILVLPAAAGQPVAESAASLGIGVVRSVGECLDLLEDLGPSAGGRRRIADLMTRLTHRLGLRGTAAGSPS